MGTDALKEFIIKHKLFAILRGVEIEGSLYAVHALAQAGVCLAEVTFNQGDPGRFENTAEIIAALIREFGNEVKIGAGTVMSERQVDLAKAAGAEFIVSPDCNTSLIRYAKKLDLVSIPGAATPTEIASAYSAGADFVKLFPAGVLGEDYVKAIRGPLNHIPLLGVGGIDTRNMEGLKRAGMVGFGLGGNLVNKKWIENREYRKIETAAKEYLEILNS